MKLVIDVRLINTSGIGTYLKNIIPGILHAFDEVSVLGNTKEIQLFEWSKKVEIIEFNASIYSIKEQFQYPFIIPKCDILWCPHFNAPIFGVKAKAVITTIHDVYHLTPNASISRLKKIYAKILFQNAVQKSKIVLTVSEFSKTEILKYTHIDSQKLEVVYAGINKLLFRNSTSKSSIELPPDFILYVGNIKPHKNLIVLLKAYSTFPEKFRSKHPLVFIGKKEGFLTKDNTIQKFINSNDLQKHITFTGYVEDSEIPKIYKKADLFVFPSLYEGFGLPILEAIASQTKVIASNAASLPEVGGEAVIYFDPKNHLQLADLIKSNIDNSSDDEFLFVQGETQLEKFSWENSIEKHLKAFKKIK